MFIKHLLVYDIQLHCFGAIIEKSQEFNSFVISFPLQLFTTKGHNLQMFMATINIIFNLLITIS